MRDSIRRTILAMLSPSGRRARLMILTFHQIPRDHDPISPSLPHVAVFSDQMNWLSRNCNVLPLPEAAKRLRERQLPARAACITFDDGYADHHDVAAPILEEKGLPATFFITGGAVDQGIMWNDLIIEGIRRATGDLDLVALGFGAYRLANDESRRTAINHLISKLKYRELEARWRIARSVFAQATDSEPPRLMMTKNQIAALGSKGYDIGSHTINHPILKDLSPNDARYEIEASRDWVADVTGCKPKAFAYPNGKPDIDFDASHEQMARDAGFEVAVSTRWGPARADDSLFALPRFALREDDAPDLGLRLVKTVGRSYLSSR